MTNLRAGGEKAARQNGGVVSVVVIIAVGVNSDGRREVLVRAIVRFSARTPVETFALGLPVAERLSWAR